MGGESASGSSRGESASSSERALPTSGGRSALVRRQAAAVIGVEQLDPAGVHPAPLPGPPAPGSGIEARDDVTSEPAADLAAADVRGQVAQVLRLDLLVAGHGEMRIQLGAERLEHFDLGPERRAALARLAG